MDSDALRLIKAQHLIAAERALRSKAEHEMRQLRMENIRLRRAVISLQRHQTKPREDANGRAA